MIKDNFPNLLSNKIEEINKIINNIDKTQLYINMTTKSLSHKQIIIPMSTDNISKFMSFSDKHTTNINRSLKNIKSDTIVDFIHNDHHELIITFNIVTSQSNLSTIETMLKTSIL